MKPADSRARTQTREGDRGDHEAEREEILRNLPQTD